MKFEMGKDNRVGWKLGEWKMSRGKCSEWGQGDQWYMWTEGWGSRGKE